MKKLLHRMRQSIHQYKVRDLCLFERNVTIDSADRFEGMNRLTDDVTFLSSFIGYGSYVGNRTILKNIRIGRYTCIATDVMTIAGNHPTSKFATIYPAFYSTRRQSRFSYVNEEKYSDFHYIETKECIRL